MMHNYSATSSSSVVAVPATEIVRLSFQLVGLVQLTRMSNYMMIIIMMILLLRKLYINTSQPTKNQFYFMRGAAVGIGNTIYHGKVKLSASFVDGLYFHLKDPLHDWHYTLNDYLVTHHILY